MSLMRGCYHARPSPVPNRNAFRDESSSRTLATVVSAVDHVLLAGCGRLFNRDDPLETLPVEGLYAEGKSALEKGNMGRAQRYFQRLTARFPFGPYTEQAQLELAYAYYKGDKAEEATSTINRFIRTYPTHAHIAYAYYLRGLINFDLEKGFVSRLARLDVTRRDKARQNRHSMISPS